VGLRGEVAVELAGGGVDDADVEVGDEQDDAVPVSHPGFDAVLVRWPSGREKETVEHGSSPEVLR
jgi:hypothetical protein